MLPTSEIRAAGARAWPAHRMQGQVVLPDR
jgi:hypothetical protein